MVKINPIVASKIAGSLLGTGMAVGIAKLARKNNKAIGAYGSVAHTLSNPALTRKGRKDTFVQQSIEEVKDTAKFAGATALAGAATTLAAGSSNKVAQFFANQKTDIAETLNKISINGKNLKDSIKNTGIFKKFSSLPKPAQAGLAVATLFAMIATPIAAICSSSKAGAIEAKNEG